MNSCRRLTLAAAILLMAVVPQTNASFLGEDIYIPSIGRGAGASDSVWYTTVWFHNPGSEQVVASVSLLLRGRPNPTPEVQNISVPAGSVVTFKDAINELFGLTSAVGAFRIQTTGPIAVGSRIFNQPGDAISESQGQLMAGLPASFSIGLGESVEVPGVLNPQDQSFRSNFGFVETGGATAQVQVAVKDGNGLVLGSRIYTVGPYEALQRTVESIIPEDSVDGGSLRFEVVNGDGSILAFGSAVASGVQSQDPTTLDMTLDSQLIGDGGGGTISGVEAGPGLEGGGEEGVVTLSVMADEGIAVSENGVAIKEAGVTAEHLASDALGCLGQRIETPFTQTVIAGVGGVWFLANDGLEIPSAGRWKVGYRVLLEVRNAAFSTLTDPVNVALFATESELLVRNSLSVVGLQVDVAQSLYLTVSGEALITVDEPAIVVLGARTSRGDLIATLHPHYLNLAEGLPDPDTAAYQFAECVYTPVEPEE